MHDRFDQEFNKSEWQRVLPLGPHGIAPLIRTSGRSPLPALLAGLHRSILTLATLAHGAVGFGRLAASGTAKPLLLEREPRTDRRRAARSRTHEQGRPAGRRAAVPRPLHKAA